VTLLLVGVIAVLNARERVTPKAYGSQRRARYEIRPETRRIEPPPEPDTREKPKEDSASVMVVDLDPPALQPAAIEAPRLDFALPNPRAEVPGVRLPYVLPVPARATIARPTERPGQRTEVTRPQKAEGPLDLGGVDEPPRELAGNPKPVYPDREDRLGIAGDVRVEILVDERGRIEDFKILSGRAAFQDAVRRVMGRWRFTPAKHGGRVVKVRGIKTIQFRPRGRR